MMKIKKLITIAPLMLLLTACGGGGDGELLLAPAQQPDSGADTASGGEEDTVSGSGETSSGGDTGTETGTDSPVDATDAVEEEEEPYVAEAAATSELSSDDHFDFSTRWDLAIDFDIDAATGTTGFLSICTEYEFDGEDAYGVNFDKCALRASIVDGFYNGQMPVTNDITSVLAVIWFADESGAPVYNEFDLVNGQQSIEWR
jgi:hypothetical protein